MYDMDDQTLDQWLGPAAGDATDEQRDALRRAFEAVGERYPGDDDQEEQMEASSGAAQIVLGDESVGSLTARWREAKHAERAAMWRLTGGILAALGAGESEAGIAARTGLSRETVRHAAGK